VTYEKRGSFSGVYTIQNIVILIGIKRSYFGRRQVNIEIA